MSSLNIPGSPSPPFTLQPDIFTSSIAALFTTMSDAEPMNPGNIPTTLASSAQASLQSKLSSMRTTFATSTQANQNSQSSISSATPAATSTSSPNASSSNSLTSSSQTGTSALSEKTSSGAAASGSTTGSATGASTTSASSDGAALAKSTSGGGMSPGTKAAIAVPIVVVALVALILAILLMRRRKRRREEKGEPAEKVPLAAQKKNWTRHLRIFSFDTELLMGGRFSSTNSVRTRDTGSLRSGVSSQTSQPPSVHTVDEVAPPYRDAISTAQPPSIGQVMAGTAAAGVGRSASTATAGTFGTAGTVGTAPPPYGAGASRAHTPGTPSTLGPRNPFSDSAPVSPVEASPFNDPPHQSPAVSRNSSFYTHRDDTSTLGGASEAASIREATLARNASVMSGGRIINNVNHS